MASVRKLQEMARASRPAGWEEFEAIEAAGSVSVEDAEARYREAAESDPTLLSLGGSV